jgi:uncharacterized protein (TIGR02246 family)
MYWSFCVPLVVFLAVCGGQPNLHAQGTPTELLNGLMKADNISDLEAVLELYADDAVLLPPNEPLVTGKPAIRTRYAQLFAKTRMEVRFEPEDVRIDGSLAVLRGRTVGKRVSSDGSKTEDLGNKFLMILKRVGSDWRISALMWNADR